jgi:hypothetical protein
MDALIRFFNFVESQKAEGKFVGCTLLGVGGALDGVQFNILDDRLKNSNVLYKSLKCDNNSSE